MLDHYIKLLTENFDFSYVLVVNILTYIIIKFIDEVNGELCVKTWQKRIITIISIAIVFLIYKFNDYDNMIRLVNSSILAPISWSWLLKPICKKFNIDYKDVGKYLD